MELKECPFCGGESEICDPAIDGFYVECANAKCLVNPQTWCYDDKEGAIEAWNTRYERTCALEINTDMSAIRCGKCGYEVSRGTVLQDVKFCPNCGARVINE